MGDDYGRLGFAFRIRPMLGFEIMARSGAARRGRLHTPHGMVETPVFMPVGTRGTVKGLGPDDLRATGVSIVLGNTYHLFAQPGHELIRDVHPQVGEIKEHVETVKEAVMPDKG